MWARSKEFVKRFVPSRALSAYHAGLAFAGAARARFPSRKLVVIGVTGTKGKSTTVELVRAILAEAGIRAASLSTIRFSIAGETRPNLYKMTMPGRFVIQTFLREALDAGCTHAVLEMTSQGVLQSRHRWIDLDALIVTHLSPEHLESHGSFEQYAAAKLAIAESLGRSPKRKKILVLNAEDKESVRFRKVKNVAQVFFRERDLEDKGISTPLPGRFNRENVAAAAALTAALGISGDAIRRAVASVRMIPGRVEEVVSTPFKIIVDYAHTADSLAKVYGVFREAPKICVLGGTGGGRDAWKRPLMGAIAATHCKKIFLTDEDPYDEDPERIVQDVARGISKPIAAIIMDRRAAIRAAIEAAQPGDVILITGKGTDPFLCGPHGSLTPWSDARVAKEEFALWNEARKSSSRRS